MSNFESNQPFKLSTSRDLSRFSTKAARKLLSRAQAEDFCVLPLSIIETKNEEVLCVVAAFSDHEAAQRLRFITGYRIKVYEATEKSIKKAIFNAYCGDEEDLTSLSKIADKATEKVEYPSLPFRTEGQASDLLATLLEYCIAHQATDLHLVPHEKGVDARIRHQNRELTDPSRICSKQVYEKVVQRLKVLAKLDITTKQTAQEGKIHIPTSYGEVFGRVSILPVIYGEKIVIRFSGHHNGLQFDSITINRSLRDEFEKHIQSPGLLLICGPVGSGKTTMLYALMEYLSGKNKTLVSVEDPVERVVPWMSQTEVTQNLSYEAALKALLRQDPDAILIGEIRDGGVAREAMKAALSGHLIFSSLHAEDSLQAFHRLSGFGIDREIASQGVQLVCAQKLERSLCKSCKVFDLKATNLLGGEVYKEVGCTQCNGSGYSSLCVVTDHLITSRNLHVSFADSLAAHVQEGNLSMLQFEQLKSAYEHQRSSVQTKRLHGNFQSRE